MNKDIKNFQNIYEKFEDNYIISERTIGINGQNNIIQKQYQQYTKIPFNKREQESGANASSIEPLAVWIDSISDENPEGNIWTSSPGLKTPPATLPA